MKGNFIWAINKLKKDQHGMKEVILFGSDPILFKDGKNACFSVNRLF